MMSASNPFNSVSADLQMRTSTRPEIVDIKSDKGREMIRRQNDNAVVGATVGNLKWLVIGLGVVVMGIVMYFYFRNATAAKRRMIRQSELVTATKVQAGACVELFERVAEGDTIEEGSEAWRALARASKAGKAQNIAWRIVDRKGNVYMSSTSPAKVGSARPFMSIADEEASNAQNVLKTIVSAGETGGDTVHFVVRSHKSGVEKGITAYVYPLTRENHFFFVTQLWPTADY